MKPYKLAVLTASVIGALWGVGASAQTFNYNNSDLLLGIRSSTGGTNDLVVDIGAASQYITASAPITISSTYFTSGQLADAGISLNGLYFSVFGNVTGASSYGPNNTLWVTKANNSYATTGAGTPFTVQTSVQQAGTRSQMESIAFGATLISYYNTLPPQDNTASAVIVPSAFNQSAEGAISYTVGIGSGGNFAGNFGSVNNIENSTGAGFTSSGAALVSELYQLNPSNAGSPATELGYFQLNTDGTLLYTPGPVPEPSTWAILGIGLISFLAVRRMKNTKQTKFNSQ